MPADTTPPASAIRLAPTLTLTCVNANVHSVHLADGAHVGNLKRIGAVWKFKAVGYDACGAVEPGGGPLTDQHNCLFEQPDAAQVNALLAPLVSYPLPVGASMKSNVVKAAHP